MRPTLNLPRMRDFLAKYVWRIIGGLIVCVGSFVSLSIWNWWDLSLSTCGFVSIALGVLYVPIGGNVLKWLGFVDDVS